MFRHVRIAVFTLFGLVPVAILVLSYSPQLQWNRLFPKTNPAVFLQSRVLSKNEMTDTSFQREENNDNISFRKFFVEHPFDNDIQNRRFLSLSEEGMNYFESLKPPRLELQKEGNALRKQDLLNRCKEENVNNVVDLSRFIYDDKLKIVMCVVPKAACTTWKRYFAYWNGKIDKPGITKINTRLLNLPGGILKPLSKLTKHKALKRLMTYTTFFVTRNPLVRLVSAHSSKFTDRTESNSYRNKLGKKIAFRQSKEYLKGLKIAYSRIMGASVVKNEAFDDLDESRKKEYYQYIDTINRGNISFHQFAKYVTRDLRGVYRVDVHWRPQTALCNPCALNYDYIVRFENLIEDSNFLLKYIQQNTPEEAKVFLDTSKPSLIDKQKTVQAFDGLDTATMAKLLHFYEKDFQILGYSSSLDDYLKEDHR